MMTTPVGLVRFLAGAGGVEGFGTGAKGLYLRVAAAGLYNGGEEHDGLLRRHARYCFPVHCSTMGRWPGISNAPSHLEEEEGN